MLELNSVQGYGYKQKMVWRRVNKYDYGKRLISLSNTPFLLLFQSLRHEVIPLSGPIHLTRSSSNNRSSKESYSKECRAKLLETMHLGMVYKGREMLDVEIHKRYHIENKKKVEEEE